MKRGLADITNKPKDQNEHKSMSNPLSTRKMDFTPGNSPKKKQMKQTEVIQSIQKSRQQELQKIQAWKDQSQKEFNDLNSELWKIRTDLPELELELEKLNSEVSRVERMYKEKEQELLKADERLDTELECLKDEFEMFKKRTELEFSKNIQELSKKYDTKIATLINEKQESYLGKKQDLELQIEQLETHKRDMERQFSSEVARLTAEQEAEVEKYEKKVKEEELRLNEAIFTAEKEILELKNGLERDQEHLIETEQTKTEAERRLQQLQQKADEYEVATRGIQEENKNLGEQLLAKNEHLRKMREETDGFVEKIKDCKQQLLNEEILRRRAHNELQDLKGNIRVFCRVKPDSLENCFKFTTLSILDDDDGREHIVITEPSTTGQNLATFSNKTHNRSYKFGFDKVFNMESTNSDIFEEISQLVQSALDGFNVCIFAYGQTGSGKTFTMSSPSDGLIPRSVELIFSKCQTSQEFGWNYEVEGQFLEIYNENINDLMADSYLRNLDMIKHEIKHEESSQTTTVTELTSIPLKEPAQVAEILQRANKNRATASTNSNRRSSRSHSVFILHLKGTNSKTGEVVSGKLNLIDLAGSERISQSMVTGERLRETQSINRSLSSLGDVIHSLCNKNSHIPYRNSKLTYLLQYSLGGNSKTLMFVNISTNAKHFNETINSLRFATKVNNTQMGQIS